MHGGLKLKTCSESISISLATFDGYPWDKIQELEDELERGILKQLFYKIDANKIPLSRYRKLHHKQIWKYIVSLVALTVVAVAGIYLAMPNKTEEIFSDYIKDF